MANSDRRLRPRDRWRSDRQLLFRTFWADVQWWVIGALFLGTLVLGFLGFDGYEAAIGEPSGFWDVLYLDLQLFVLESGALKVASAIPVSLQIARLLAPVAVVALMHQTLAPLLRDQFQLLRLQRARGHVVVCGLGHRGLEVARSLRERGHQVVAIEQDEELDHVRVCRAAGVPVLVGDATDLAILRKARTGRASRLVAFCGDDAVNVKIVAGAKRLAAGRTEPLDCLVHIYEGQLCSLLQADGPAGSDGLPYNLEFFNTYDRGAQAALLRYPPFPDSDLRDQPHLLVVGLGWLGASLVRQAALHWQLTPHGERGQLRITVVDVNAESELESLQARHRRIEDVCDIVPATLDVQSGRFVSGEFLGSDTPPVSMAYVCIDDDVLSLQAGLALHRLLEPEVTIVMRALTRAGLPALFEGTPRGAFERLHAFPLVDRVCDPDLLFGGDDEIIARALHDIYRANREAERRGQPERDWPEDPALASWDELDEEYRDASRDQAAHTWDKLEAVGCRLEPSEGWELPISFTHKDLELLGRMEHQRWQAERLRHGWTLGPRSLERKQSPYLVPWDDLEEDIKEYDREFVRELPVILAKLGNRIVRVPGSKPTAVA